MEKRVRSSQKLLIESTLECITDLEGDKNPPSTKQQKDWGLILGNLLTEYRFIWKNTKEQQITSKLSGVAKSVRCHYSLKKRREMVIELRAVE